MQFDDYEMPEKEVKYIVESMIDKARSGDAAAAQWLEDHGYMPKLRGKYKPLKKPKVAIHGGEAIELEPKPRPYNNELLGPDEDKINRGED